MTMKMKFQQLGWWSAALILALSTVFLPLQASAQDNDQDQDDPPTRVARLGYIEGSVSFQPAGEEDWVQAVPNRPMTTGDKLWADKDSRAELQLGSAVIRLNENTGISFLNLDDNTIQLQLSSGSISVRAKRLDDNDDFEIDTPNLAFTISQPGRYRLNASEDGTYTQIALRDGGGQATGNGQTYTLHSGQQGTFSGTDALNADVEDIGGQDQFDNWAYDRDRRSDDSPSAHYLAANVVGYQDLDDNGDWRDDSNYGHVWYPHVEAGWAPYHTGHWDWIAPWGYTWVDDSSWGYAPFHYGRWVEVGGRWGWIGGPVEVRAVYAPALVVFIGGGPGGFGGNVGWFPLGPREVYVPPYQVSRGYMNRVNISNTTVNVTQVTNVYNTTIINKSTTITNITYANRNVQGAVTVVPQRAFAGAQPVAKAAVAVNAQQIASASIGTRAAVAPTRESVLGAHAATAGHVTAPPAAVANRQVIAKKTPPPPPVPFAKQQQALAAHPGQPVARTQMQSLRPTGAAAPQPMVKVAPAGKPATATTGHPGPPQNAGRPGQPAPGNQMGNRPPNQPAPNQPATNPPGQNRPAPNQSPAAPAEANRPPTGQMNRPPQPAEPNRPPTAQPQNSRPPQPNQPEPGRPQPNRPAEPPAQNNRPPAAQQNNNRPTQPVEPARPQANRPAEPPARTDRPAAAQPNNRPEPARPEAKPAQPAPRQAPPAAERPAQRTPPAEAKPAPPREQPKPAPEKKKTDEEKKKEKPPGV